MLGFVIEDINLNQLSEEDFQRIRKAVPEHGVVAIKGQSISVDTLVTLTERFGRPLHLPEGLRFNNTEKEYPALARVSNILPDGTLLKGHKAAEYWHSDGDFWQPGDNYIFNFLYSKIVPQEGGQTGFVDLRWAYEQLPAATQEELIDKTVLVSCDDIPDFKDATEEERQPDALHKIKHEHIETQRVGLYFGHAKAAVHNVAPETSDRLMGELVAAIENPSIQYIHEWEEGDLLIWDNTSVMHRGMGGYKDYPRLLFRTQAFISPQ
ncbi:MAG: TauD/TfdA dioxygenase family protein [Aureispira sp.]